MATSLTVEQVKQEIQDFWEDFSGKDASTLQRFYSGAATVVDSSSPGHDTGHPGTARRGREYFQRHSSVEVELGDIHVILLGDHAEAAVASYTFELHGSHNVGANIETDESPRQGRASQVFSCGPHGSVCVTHEHFSLPVEVRSEPVVFHSKLDLIRIPS